jgi:cytochrome c-type biogenesis protein CcmH
MLFWTIAALLAAAVAALMGLALLRGRAGGVETAQDLNVYRLQLKSVETDLARGVIAAEDAERLRLEISRRMLEADKATAVTERSAPRAATVAVALAGGVVLAAAFVLYQRIGAPGYEDMPIGARVEHSDTLIANRPTIDEAEAAAAANRAAPPPPDAQFADQMTRLRAAIAARPDDPVGLELLARNEAILGNYHDAWTAQRRLIEIKGDAATVEDRLTLAQMMLFATGGIVTREIEDVLGEVLALDRTNGIARFYLGMMMAQNDRPDLTFNLWAPLLEEGPDTAPWIAPIRRAIRELAWLAGEPDYVPPPAVAIGPTAAQVTAAAAMSPAEREAELRAPVRALMDEMAIAGGTADEWVLLLSALVVLGDAERAAAVYDEAKTLFADFPDELARLDDAAKGANLTSILRGPTADDVANAANLSDDEQGALIRSMVERLSDRLDTEGGSAAEWAQLIGALGTLGETERAAAKWAEAQTTFAATPADLEVVRRAAQSAGVAE